MATNLVVPDAHKRQQHRHVLRRIGGAEMPVHLLRAAQETVKGLGANGDHQRQANRPPNGIAPADPILEPEDLRGIDAKLSGLILGGAEGRELRGRIAAMILHPRPRRTRICHGLDGGKGLGGDDHQSRLGIQPPQRIGNMRAIDVGDEMAARPIVIGRQCAGCHGGAKVRAADPDIDHIRDVAAAHLIGKAAHPRQRVADLRHDIFARHLDRPAIKVAQGGMEHRTAFGFINRLACKHRITAVGHLSGVDQPQQGRTRLCVNIRLGVIEQHVLRPQRKFFGPFGIFKQRCDLSICRCTLLFLQVLPNVHHAAQ